MSFMYIYVDSDREHYHSCDDEETEIVEQVSTLYFSAELVDFQRWFAVEV